jgi:hypothetical protein
MSNHFKDLQDLSNRQLQRPPGNFYYDENHLRLYKKYRKELFKNSLLIDLMGLVSYAIVGAGEVADIIFATISYQWILKKHHSKSWAAFCFVEEILPFTDIIPSATIVWMIHHVFNKDKFFIDFVQRYDNGEIIIYHVD